MTSSNQAGDRMVTAKINTYNTRKFALDGVDLLGEGGGGKSDLEVT